MIKKCLVCGNKIETTIERIKIGRGKYCSRKCTNKSRKGKPTWNKGLKVLHSGKNHWNWQGGIIQMNGYLFIHQPNHPFARRDGYVRNNRLIAEKCLCRYLTKDEIIHHINSIRNDDRPKNLYLFTSNSSHSKYHTIKNKPILVSNLFSVG